MKVKLGLLLLIILSVNKGAQACDICGCGAGSYYIGILPEFNKKIVGLRYRSTGLTTHLGPGGSSSYLTTDEQYKTLELWGGWTIKEHFRLMAYMPVSYNSKSNESGVESKTGLSDASVLGFYRLLRGKATIANKEATRLLVQDLWIGGGVKLPTGKYNPSDKSTTSVSTNLFQLGTGSLDFILMGMYDIRFQDAGLNLTASYKINTTNQHNYYYGNRFSGSTQFYYKFRFNNKWMIAPNAGIQYEKSAIDLDEGYSVRPTGGVASFATIGAEVSFNKFTFGGNFQPVLFQELGQGAVRTGNRAMLHFSLIL
jgi:hypothetical protein